MVENNMKKRIKILIITLLTISAIVIVVVIWFLLKRMQNISDVTPEEKREFLELMDGLPSSGDSYTDEAIRKAGPYLPVLLSLKEKDIRETFQDYDLFAFFILINGLCEHKKHQQYTAKHFSKIAHPEFKLHCAVILFHENAATPEIVNYLRAALKSEKQSEILSKGLGPTFSEFKEKVEKYSDDSK
jgi:hypothetical protein